MALVWSVRVERMKITAAHVIQARLELARDSLHDFCGLIEIPGAPVEEQDERSDHAPAIKRPQARHHQILIDKLEAVERGDIRRLMVFMAPGSAKSTYASVVFPAWFMGRAKRRNVIVATYASDLGRKIGRRMRSIVRQKVYSDVFGCTLSSESSAADEWALTNENELMTGGILSGITGNRADLIVIDDPIKGRQQADSEVIRATTRSEYDDSIKTRLKPGGRIVLIQCMVGDTRVSLANGGEKLLRDIRPGDLVASYDGERIVASKVLNWASQGVDYTFEVNTKSGISVQANERHPFLVQRGSERVWTRLRDIVVGDRILRATGVSGEASFAGKRDATAQQSREDSAPLTTTSGAGLTAFDLPPQREGQEKTPSCAIDTALTLMNTRPFSNAKEASAPSAAALGAMAPQSTGKTAFASITTTKQEPSGGCFATTATSSWVEGAAQKSCNGPLSTWSVTEDEVLSILPCGREEVFDIQVEGTENFVANGLLSHNTRWHEDDLAGSILPENYDGESGPILCRDNEVWEVLCIPAQAMRLDDPLGRQPGEYMWPEWFGPDHWAAFQSNPRTWSALYQQSPTPDSGSFFKREWFTRKAPPPGTLLHKYMTSDHAPGGSQDSDFQVLRVWGIDPQRNVYHLEGFRGQVTMDILALKAADLIRRHKPFAWFPEDDNNWKASAPFIVAMLRERSIGVRIEPISPHGSDKATKALPAQGMAAMGRIFIPPTPEGDLMVDQYVKFPAGKNDDEVDALATLCRALDMAHPAILPAPKAPPGGPSDRYSRPRDPVSSDASMYG